ncbi:hypothetical protein N0V88_000581 [Collariella sp. IMI 366227]|nr:hypothetical protein N0V88_000581 [Collariella sp. IMI 366227]
MDTTDPSPPKDSQLDTLSPSHDDEPPVEITIKFPPEHHTQTWLFSPTDTFEHLLLTLSLEFPSYDWSKAKALLETKPRPPTLLKSIFTPSSDSPLPSPTSTTHPPPPRAPNLSPYHPHRRPLRLRHAARQPRPCRARYARQTPSQRQFTSDTTYTFHTLRPSSPPQPARSLAFLERLKVTRIWG